MRNTGVKTTQVVGHGMWVSLLVGMLLMGRVGFAQAEMGQMTGSTSPEVEAARSSMEQARAMVRNAEADLQQQRANMETTTALVKDLDERWTAVKEKFDKGEASEADVRQAEKSLSIARATLESQKAAVYAAEARVHSAQAILSGAQYHLMLRQEAAARFYLPGVGPVAESQLFIPAEPLRKQVSLSMQNVTLADFMNQLSQSSGIPITIHESVPKGIEVTTAELYGVTTAEALHIVLQRSGLRAVPTEDRQGILIVPQNKLEIKGSTVPRQFAASANNGTMTQPPLVSLVAGYEWTAPNGKFTGTNGKFTGNGLTMRAAYTNGNGIYCPRCNTALQSDWHFCPKCGVKNEFAQVADWKFCPLCGKSMLANIPNARTGTPQLGQTNVRRASVKQQKAR